jgi:hypothetical protein
VLSVSIYLQRMGETGGAGKLEAIHHGGTLAAIDAEPMHAHTLVRRVKRIHRQACILAAAVIDDKDKQTAFAQLSNDLNQGRTMIAAGDDGAAFEGHEERNPI